MKAKNERTPERQDTIKIANVKVNMVINERGKKQNERQT